MHGYELIEQHAKQNNVDLDDGQYRLWYVPNETDVQLCGIGERQGFDNLTASYDWARQHRYLENLILTGPGGRHEYVEDKDRYPTRR